MSLAPAPPVADRIEQLILLTERLTTLLAQQAQAFESRRPYDAAAAMPETTQLANQYRHEAQRLRAEAASLLGQVPAALRQRLLRATEAFDAVVARHGRAVTAAKTVTEGLVHAIANEIAAQRAAMSGYGPKGVKAPAASSTSVTLNQRA